MPPPIGVEPAEDVGSETARRYRFQWTYASIICCLLLDETQDVVEVFCEHHEDVLIKHSDGTFTGDQIKTRGPDQPLWKASEAVVVASFAKFAALDDRFPAKFRAFRFLTNHPLCSTGSGQDLRRILDEVRSVDSVAVATTGLKAFVQRIAKKAACSEQGVFSTLGKCEVSDELPRLRDVDLRLVDTLTQVWPSAADCSHTQIRRAARELVSECARASSLASEDCLPGYIPSVTLAAEAEVTKKINGKRLERLSVMKILETGLDAVFPLLAPPEALAAPGTEAGELLPRKLEAGGFSAGLLSPAADPRDKAQYLSVVWTKKHGRDEGLQRYSHIRSIVLSDAASAFEHSKLPIGHFGKEMLVELRRRFRERKLLGDQLYECSAEHLEGFAFDLTAECKVYWSSDRPWESE